MFERPNKTLLFGPFYLTNHTIINAVSTRNNKILLSTKKALINPPHNICTAGRVKLARAGEIPAGENLAANEPHIFKELVVTMKERMNNDFSGSHKCQRWSVSAGSINTLCSPVKKKTVQLYYFHSN